MKLILIHGRAQGGKDHISLRKTWIATLEAGLKKSGLSLPVSNEDVIFPFYGDLLDKLVDEYNVPVETIIKRGVESNSTDARFFHDFLLEVADNSNISLQEIAEEKTTEITERGPLNWEWVHSILKAIDKKSSWSEASLKKFTYDVFLYLTIPAIRQEINENVISSFANETCVVVGHSLGSIVSYNLLRESSSIKAFKFITVGSPLGINAVKKYLKSPIKMPDCVKNGWFNAYDERDIVALKPLNKEYFNINPSIKNKNDVDNHTSNRHGIEGYLNDKDIAREIYNALTNDYT
jgi:hypothetical protein